MVDYSGIINQAAATYGVDPGLIHGVLQTESSMNPNAVGPDTKYGRAVGIGQLIPDTAKRLGVNDPTDPQEAIPAVAKLLRENLDRYGNVDDALRAYHGGTDKNNWGEKTQAYVGKVKSNMPAQDYKPDNDPMWDIINGRQPQAPVATAAYKPDNDPMWDIMNGQTAPQAADASETQNAAYNPPATEKRAETKPTGTEEKGLLQNLDDFTRATTHHISNGLLGITQLGAHVLAPGSTFTNNLDRALAAREAQYQHDISGGGWGSWGGAALGSVTDPTNAVLGGAGVASIANPLARGAVMGATAGLMAPVTEGNNYAGNKLLQTAAGAALGGAAEKFAAPVVDKLINKLRPGVAQPARGTATPMTPDAAKAEMANLERAKDSGELAPEEANARMQELAESILGKRPMPTVTPEPGGRVPPGTAEQQRADEFAQLGITPTKGQITRNAAQYSFERNARATSPEIAQRFADQDTALRNKLLDLGAATATEKYTAGNTLIQKITAADAPVNASIKAAYTRAKNMAGGDTIIPTTAALDKFNLVKDEFGEELIPSPIKNRLQAIANGESAYTINDAEKLIKVINRNYKPNALDSKGQQQAAALDELRKGVKGSLDELTAGDIGSEAAAAFGDARALAAHRFRMIEDTPALKAVVNEQATPDTFIDKFIINGDVAGLRSLRKLVGKDEEAGGIVKSQIAEYLRTKGFGQDVSGDKPFAQESYNRALKAIGDSKLGTFFTPKEVETLKLIGKVGSYIHQQPSGSAVNSSNTAGVLMSMLGKIGGAIPLARDVVKGAREISYGQSVKGALNPQVNPPVNTAAFVGKIYE